MEKKSLSMTEMTLLGALGLSVAAILKILLSRTRRGTGVKDKPIIVSGGSLHVSSRASFDATYDGYLQFNENNLYGIGLVEISVNGGDPVKLTPSPGTWGITFTRPASSNLKVSGDSGPQVTFDAQANQFYQAFKDYYLGIAKAHSDNSFVTQISVSGGLGNGSWSVPSNIFWVKIHYSQ